MRCPDGEESGLVPPWIRIFLCPVSSDTTPMSASSYEYVSAIATVNSTALPEGRKDGCRKKRSPRCSSTLSNSRGGPPDAATRNRSNHAQTMVSSGPHVAPAMPLTASQTLTGAPPLTATLRSVAVGACQKPSHLPSDRKSVV